jgi:uncharacterized Ntn-hydrolase superfamily protein
VTYSIVALDPVTGDLGVATQSKFPAVGAVVPWARADAGAIATQSFANVTYGPNGLAMLAAGSSAADTLAHLVAEDALREQRQAGIVDRHGGAATHTGRECFAWAGGRTGKGYAAQGNILASAAVVDGIAETFEAGGKPFAELLVACLLAAEAAGGDRRGRQSAALLIVREGGGYGGGNDRLMDIRIDEHEDPVPELARVLDLHRLYLDRPPVESLLPVDERLGAELRRHLESLGAGPGSRFASVYQPMWQVLGEEAPSPAQATDGISGSGTAGGGTADSGPSGGAEDAERPFVGEPRPLPSGWDDAWQDALTAWMGVENLEARAAAPGWIDPRVLTFLREKATLQR